MPREKGCEKNSIDGRKEKEMALRWEWNDIIGYCEDEYGRTLTLHKGNAFVIALDETHETEMVEGEEKDFVSWNMAWFFISEDHAKNCFGITKGYEKSNMGIKKLKLDINHPETKKLINLVVKAKLPCTIELYEGEKK